MAKKKNKKLHKLLFQIVGYNIAGLAFFAASYSTFWLLYEFVIKGDFLVAKIVGNMLGLTVNYLIERYWVFRRDNAKKRSFAEAARYWILSFVNFWIDIAIVYLLKEYAGITPYIGNFVSSWFFTVWNFLWYKYWVFPEYKAKRPKRVAAKRKYA